MQENDTYRQAKLLRAKERVADLKKFYSSLLSYAVVISVLAGINYYFDEWHYPWFLWAAFGWGIGLIFQAFKLFGRNPFLSKNWEERKIKEFMDKERNL